MKSNIVRRVVKTAQLVIDTGTTIRDAGKQLGIGKSTVFKDLTERLKDIDLELYKQVRKVLDYNKSVRHLRGGESTQRRYKKNIKVNQPMDFIEIKGKFEL